MSTWYPELKDAEYLSDRYHGDGLSMREIADEIGCSVSAVSDWFDRHDIRPRKSGKPYADDRLRDESWLYERYVVEGLSQAAIADICDCTPFTVGSWLDKHGIERRQGGDIKSRGTGPDNPNWKGGHREYGPNWYDQRREARERDGYQCRVCGVDEADLEYELDVHHIVPRRGFTNDGDFDHEAANQLDNLVTMCRSCHIRWEDIGLIPMADS